MADEPGIDYPEERTAVDVQAASRGDLVLSFVEAVKGREVVLSVGKDRSQRRIRLEPGERLELIWRGPTEMRSVPAELISVETGANPTWLVGLVGPATRGQRRAAVRAPVTFPVELQLGEQVLPGTGVDLSEGGFRCFLRPPADPAPPVEQADAPDTDEPAEDGGAASAIAVGSVVTATITLGANQLSAQAEILRQHAGEEWRAQLSLRFLDLSEQGEDLIRRHVFAELRDLRARGAI